MARFISSRALTFDDVHLVPQYSEIESRKTDVDLSVSLNNSEIVLKTPFIASPMDTVSGPEMAIAIQKEAGGLAILHRYCPIVNHADSVRRVVSSGASVGGAIGVNGDYLERAEALVEAGAGVICVDVAHGHHSLMRQALTVLRSKFPKVHIMAGNVATIEGFNALSDWGADSVRLGVGGGSICETRIKTGHGYPMLQNILDVSTSSRRSQLISDGGIKQYGDIVKALAAGANLVMMGSMFSGTDQSPGQLIETDRGLGKIYRGMASKESQIEWRGYYASSEGISTTVPYKGSVKDILADMQNAVSSGFSYSGARNQRELREKAVFVEVSSASAIEATTHILRP